MYSWAGTAPIRRRRSSSLKSIVGEHGLSFAPVVWMAIAVLSSAPPFAASQLANPARNLGRSAMTVLQAPRVNGADPRRGGPPQQLLSHGLRDILGSIGVWLNHDYLQRIRSCCPLSQNR